MFAVEHWRDLVVAGVAAAGRLTHGGAGTADGPENHLAAGAELLAGNGANARAAGDGDKCCGGKNDKSDLTHFLSSLRIVADSYPR